MADRAVNSFPLSYFQICVCVCGWVGESHYVMRGKWDKNSFCVNPWGMVVVFGEGWSNSVINIRVSVLKSSYSSFNTFPAVTFVKLSFPSSLLSPPPAIIHPSSVQSIIIFIMLHHASLYSLLIPCETESSWKHISCSLSYLIHLCIEHSPWDLLEALRLCRRQLKPDSGG